MGPPYMGPPLGFPKFGVEKPLLGYFRPFRFQAGVMDPSP